MEDENDAKEAMARAGRSGARDGLIDFNRYSIEQLLELESSIDPQAFPENHRNLLTVLRAKQSSLGTPAPSSNGSVEGRFTTRDGLLGWFEAKFARSPVYGWGSIQIGATEATLSAWQHTWLGVPIQNQMSFSLFQTLIGLA